MKTTLIVFVLSAAILGGSNAAVARPGNEQRYEAPRVQHTTQRDRGNSKYQTRGHRDAHGPARYDHRRGRVSDRRMHQHPRVRHGWSHPHPGHRRAWSKHGLSNHGWPKHGWSHRHGHGNYKGRGHYYPGPRGHAPVRPRHRSSNGLSIILRGHF